MKDKRPLRGQIKIFVLMSSVYPKWVFFEFEQYNIANESWGVVESVNIKSTDYTTECVGKQLYFIGGLENGIPTSKATVPKSTRINGNLQGTF